MQNRKSKEILVVGCVTLQTGGHWIKVLESPAHHLAEMQMVHVMKSLALMVPGISAGRVVTGCCFAGCLWAPLVSLSKLHAPWCLGEHHGNSYNWLAGNQDGGRYSLNPAVVTLAVAAYASTVEYEGPSLVKGGTFPQLKIVAARVYCSK